MLVVCTLHTLKHIGLRGGGDFAKGAHKEQECCLLYRMSMVPFLRGMGWINTEWIITEWKGVNGSCSYEYLGFEERVTVTLL